MNNETLKQWREALKMTQDELAKELGVAMNTISRWENGTRSIPIYLPLALETIERRQKPAAEATETADNTSS